MLLIPAWSSKSSPLPKLSENNCHQMFFRWHSSPWGDEIPFFWFVNKIEYYDNGMFVQFS